MHENLKYTLKLDEGIKPFPEPNTIENEYALDIIRSKDPRNPEHRSEISDWQAIYSDNHYGTHYLLYAKFIGIRTEEFYVVEKIQLYVQNYRGMIPIGLIGHATIEEMEITDTDPDIDSRFPERKKYFLQVGLKGLDGKNTYTSFEPKTVLKLKTGDIIMTEPIFVPANEDLSRIYVQGDLIKSDFVDEMFMDRLGDDVYITEEGEDRLLELNVLSLISPNRLSDAGISKENSEIEYTTSAVANFKERSEKKTRAHPCIPIYSICEIEK